VIGSLYPLILITSPQPLSQGSGPKFLIYCVIPPSLLGEGGKEDEVKIIEVAWEISLSGIRRT
jgi:hypothetical protein